MGRHKNHRKRQVEVTIDHIGLDGLGIGTSGDLEVRIAGGLPGDCLVARLEHYSPHRPTAFGRIDEMQRPSPDRRDSPCRIAQACGGCALISMTDPGQERAKLELLRRELGEAFPQAQLPDRLHRAEPLLGYRRRAKYVVAHHAGRVRFGAYARRSHSFVATERCPVVTPAIGQTLEPLAAALERAHVVIDGRGRPGLRYVQLRNNHAGELLVTLVARRRDRSLQRAAEALAAEVAGLIGVTLDLNSGAGDAVLTGRGELLWGRAELRERISGVGVMVDPYAFTQVHGPAGEMLSEMVAGLLGPSSAATVVDLFAGVGALGLAAAGHGHRVVAVDRVLSGVRAGAHAARAARLPASFVAMDSADFLRGLRPGRDGIETAVVDPPRRGLSNEALEALVASGVRNLVYVSCAPPALRRDLRGLVAGRFRVTRCKVLDLFPQTPAVETVLLLSR